MYLSEVDFRTLPICFAEEEMVATIPLRRRANQLFDPNKYFAFVVEYEELDWPDEVGVNAIYDEKDTSFEDPRILDLTRPQGSLSWQEMDRRITYHINRITSHLFQPYLYEFYTREAVNGWNVTLNKIHELRFKATEEALYTAVRLYRDIRNAVGDRTRRLMIEQWAMALNEDSRCAELEEEYLLKLHEVLTVLCEEPNPFRQGQFLDEIETTLEEVKGRLDRVSSKSYDPEKYL